MKEHAPDINSNLGVSGLDNFTPNITHSGQAQDSLALPIESC